MALRQLTKFEVSLLRTRPPRSRAERRIAADRQQQREAHRERIHQLYGKDTE